MTRVLSLAKLAIPTALGLTAMVLVWMYLERNASYHSPWSGQHIDDPPRLRALADMDRWRAERDAKRREREEILKNLTAEKMVVLGEEIVHGDRGKCFQCHKIGEQGTGIQGPNLADIGARAATRVDGMSDLQYLAQSLYDPSAFIVPEFSSGMVPVSEPPIGLNDDEVLWVVAYLQTLGGTPTVTPNTVLEH